jgi:hypothetical protein
VIDLPARFPENSYEGNLLHRYLSIRDIAQTNTFRETHQQEMRTLLDTHLPYMPEDAKQYMVNLRYIKVPGILYASDHPASPEDRALIQRAHNAFKFSGMDDYLQNLG